MIKKSENEKVIASFVAVILFLTFISLYVPGYAFLSILLLCVLFLLTLSYHWNFHQIIKPLNDLFYASLRRNGGSKSPPSDDEV